jgi:hypothetical protein
LTAKITEAEHAWEHGGTKGADVVEVLKTQLRAAKAASEKVSMVLRAMED